MFRLKTHLPRRRLVRLAWCSVLGLAVLGAGLFALEEASSPAPSASQAGRRDAHEARTVAEIPVFRRPEFQRRLREVEARLQAGEPEAARGEATALLTAWPHLAPLRLALARIELALDRPEAAAAQLLIAAKDGLREADLLDSDPAFAPLRALPDARQALEIMRVAPESDPESLPPPAPLPAPLTGGAALLTPANSEWSPRERAVRAWIALPDASPAMPLASTDAGPAARLLNRLRAEGRAAGAEGDFYENRDDDHSALDVARFPGLVPVEHGPEAQQAGFARGFPKGLAITAGGRLFPPLIGNSSTAIVSSPFWRCEARAALTDPNKTWELWREYASNQIYVYPEHRDHDPIAEDGAQAGAGTGAQAAAEAGHGDLFPANTPYMIVSQGSSYSDQTALESLAMMLAALRPDTKERLIRERLLAPTLQMLWRRGQAGIETDEDYLSPRAHPPVFDPKRAEPLRLIRMANALTPQDIPPMVRIQVLDESAPRPGLDLFGDGLSRTLFDTPSSVARLYRGTAKTYRMTVSAAGTTPRDARPLRFLWKVIQGDPAKVRITPLGDQGAAARIEVDWDPEQTSADGLRSWRVDVAVFAETRGGTEDGGRLLSAPAFVSVAFPPRQELAFDNDGRLQMASYDSAARRDVYSDPLLWPRRQWRDIYHYGPDGALKGWTRMAEDGVSRYDASGARVAETDDQGRPLRLEKMAYPVAGPAHARRVTPTGRGVFLSPNPDPAGSDDRPGEPQTETPR